jgi:hypothetical protein
MAAAAQREAMNAARNVSEEQLLDVLYEVLAQGTDPGEKLTRGEVESFLHAHARSKKPVSEILAFFAQHRLPLDAEAYAADPALGQLASGIHRERGPSSSLFAIEQVEPPDDAGEARETLADTPTNRNKLPVVPMAAPMAAETSGLKARATPPWADARALRYAALGFGFVLVAGLALSMRHSAALESELQAARLQQRTTDSALTALEQRAEGLRAEVARREQEQQQLSQRFHEFVADQAKEQAAAESALKSLLGARYDTLRMRALAAETAVVPTR